jgi:hypothetical protein
MTSLRFAFERDVEVDVAVAILIAPGTNRRRKPR